MKKIKKNNMNRNFTNNHIMRIDIDSIYRKLRVAIENRMEYQRRQDELWNKIRRTHGDYSVQMDKIAKKIGQETHNINLQIAELCKYRKTHKAMNMADSYLSSEISRISKIVSSTERKISDVNRGYYGLISSRGVSHTNTYALEQYVAMKRDQMAKLKKWKQHVSQYRVA